MPGDGIAGTLGRGAARECVNHLLAQALSILHAFGYGLPIVTGDHPRRHHPRVGVPHGHNALLSADGDPINLAKRILHVVSSPHRRSVLSEGALSTVGSDGARLEQMVGGILTMIRGAETCGERRRSLRRAR